MSPSFIVYKKLQQVKKSKGQAQSNTLLVNRVKIIPLEMEYNARDWNFQAF